MMLSELNVGDIPDDGKAKTVFKEGKFKELEKIDSEGLPSGEMKDIWEKSGWFEDEESDADNWKPMVIQQPRQEAPVKHKQNPKHIPNADEAIEKAKMI